ncbi:AraC family transcriptional regulator [Mycobacteroides immunogenum]|nr:helix-turn-helix transcriptional regulator [Mycobacteroides immunogenum]
MTGFEGAPSYKSRAESEPQQAITVVRENQLMAPHGPHPINAHRLLFVRTGQQTIQVDFEEYVCGPGSLLYTRPGQIQRFPAVGNSDAGWQDAIQICFTGSSPTRFAIRVPNVIDDAFGARLWHLTDLESEKFGRSFTEIAEEHERAVTDQVGVAIELLRLLLATLLLRITRLASDKQSATVVLASPIYHQFRRELEELFASIHTTNEYAHRLGYSPRTLNRACLTESGHTAKELIDTRIALEAKRLLIYTHLPVATIARRLGFSEASNFGKHFTRMSGGSPPAEFRRLHQGLW